MGKLAGNKTITINEMSQEIDLSKYLGDNLDDNVIEAIANASVEIINSRTLDGTDINYKQFKKYSKKYADKKGVDVNSVDLFLEGDMLDSVKYDINGSKIRLFIDNELDTKKGYNHHVGDTLPKRSWFGVTVNELNTMIESLSSGESDSTSEGFTLKDLQSALAQLGLEQVE